MRLTNGAKVQRSASCRSRRELSNEYLLATFGFDTAENEPCKVCPLSTYRYPRSCRCSTTSGPADGPGRTLQILVAQTGCCASSRISVFPRVGLKGKIRQTIFLTQIRRNNAPQIDTFQFAGAGFLAGKLKEF